MQPATNSTREGGFPLREKQPFPPLLAATLPTQLTPGRIRSAREPARVNALSTYWRGTRDRRNGGGEKGRPGHRSALTSPLVILMAKYMSPKEPEPIFRTSLYLFPTMNSALEPLLLAMATEGMGDGGYFPRRQPASSSAGSSCSTTARDGTRGVVVGGTLRSRRLGSR